MTLQKREKILGSSAIGLLVLLLLYLFWPEKQSTIQELRDQCEIKQAELDRNKNRALQAEKSKIRLADWQRRSLPADQEIAQSLYENWLRNLVSKSSFSNISITGQPAQYARDLTASRATTTSKKSGSSQPENFVYIRYSLKIKCQGSLEKLTRFLYDFYSAGHLHKISTINIKPIKNSSDLDLDLTVEALSLPGSKQKDKLYVETGKILKLSLDEYKKTIVDRNLFAAYKPAAPPRSRDTGPKDPPKPPKINPLQFSYLTAIIEADGVPEAWLLERTTGQTLRLHEGEGFKIDKYNGKVIRIGYNEIEIELDGQNHTIGYGSNLKM
jgi:hypothetical protein